MNWIAPAYFYPSPSSIYWATLLGLRQVHAVIINPQNGYKRTLSISDMANWHWAVNQCHQLGITPVGYVSTRWGKRPIAECQSEMAFYKADFHVTGFFFDEAATSIDMLPFYATLRKATDGMVILNPGAQPDVHYFDLANVVITRETSDTALSVLTADEARQASKVCHIISGCDALGALDQLIKLPSVGYRWFNEKAGDYTAMPDYIRLLDGLL